MSVPASVWLDRHMRCGFDSQVVEQVIEPLTLDFTLQLAGRLDGR
ncbi:MAG: hypothetical protein AB8I08_02735 [Sandaracinaceae bacterium]